ncbi:LacI family DNA-binding transcriptional regulator [Sulfobacillus sp. hq2]|uniref:LacI family DNA-binding transcriptional regulator n=1 Tax=Sulfobacillus TaxID=28033 RepID=UPI000CD1759B|nr:LacI family DNA-binding transcriptional regulator [Sulfobacillus sp. hq2]POB11056.1 LacI family transcriptional regulator [Sulfobacillus sp. hq2]
MATIKDIAKRAGVSVSCVSRAINGYPDISAETRQKVLKIVEELHYYPKASARHLVTNQTHMIGLIFETHDQSGLMHPYIAKVLTAFSQAIGSQGYDLLMFSNSRKPFDHWGFVERVKHRAVDGLFLIGKPPDLDALMETAVPMVGLDFTLTGPSAASVMSDNRQGVQQLVHLLYQQGYRRFGFAHGPLTMLPAMERLQGFYSGLRDVGLVPRPDWIWNDNFTYAGGRAAAETILRMTERPEVVLFSADLAAIGAMQTFQEHGLRIPEDISVTGFDDVDAATIVYPALTTVKQPMVELGQAAAQLLLEMLRNGQHSLPQHLTIPTEIVWRNSTMTQSLLAPDMPKEA